MPQEHVGTERRADIDWLRVGATYLLFVFHSAKVFDPAPFYHIRSDQLSFGMLVFAGFIGLWHMPLFFLLAGWSIAASLERRGSSGFVQERTRRLLVPLLTGCVLFGPVIKFLELQSGQDLTYAGLWVTPERQAGFRQLIPGGLPTRAPFDESFAAFVPTYFTQLGRFTWSHLWFLAYLFTLSLVYLPWFRRLVRATTLVARPGRWTIYLPLLPLTAIQLVLRPRWPGIQNLFDDWANVAYYSTYLWAGFLLARFPALDAILAREWTRALALGLGATLVLFAAVVTGRGGAPVLLAGSAVAGWGLVLAIAGAARGLRGFDPPVLAYLAESALPVYVLHQVAIVTIGYFLVLPLHAGVGIEFVVLVVGSAAATLAVYHWLVRPYAVTRVLLGMRPLLADRRTPLRLAGTGRWAARQAPLP